MIKPEMIPHGLALIARKAWAEGIGPTNDDDWNAAIAAALNAWPGMRIQEPHAIKWYPTVLILPIPQEDSDE